VKVLVTGNLGYIGPVLTAALIARGHEVHGFDSGLYVGFASLGLPVVAEQTLADLRDERAVRRAIARCDAVVHLAAMSNDPLGELDPALTRAVNLDATLALIRAVGERRLVLYSSASVYGVSDTACDETAAPHPLTLYSELKVAAERAAFARAPSLVLRNGTVHGPAPIIRGDLLLNSMVASALVTGEVVLTTSRLTRRPVVDVRDLVVLTADLLDRGTTGLYNVASANITVGDAAKVVAAATGAAVVERHNGADPRDYAMDTSLLRRVVGSAWRQRSLEGSVDDLVHHFRAIGLSPADVTSRRYHRIVQYQQQAGVAAATR
jgi:nucleoside-diphosphate-sugar epimerase